MRTRTCDFCGEQLRFRVINRTKVPLHPVGSSCSGKKYYRNEYLNSCCITDCPKCQSPVYFVRHNDGCVWFDSLGWPWPKHSCFDTTEHDLPQKLIDAGNSHQGALCQLWFYGVLKGEAGGAFLICNNPYAYKPRLLGLSLSRLMCPPSYIEKLEYLDGKIAAVIADGIIAFDGTFLPLDGMYKSSYKWWG